MSRQLVEQVLQRAGVKRIKPTRDGFTCCCPFHDDNSASFAVSEEGLYLCYTAHCGASGNLYRLLTQVAGYSPKAAKDVTGSLPKTGDIARVRRMRPYGERRRREGHTGTLSEHIAAVYGVYCPESLMARGFTRETLAYFEVGYDVEARAAVIPIRDPRGHLIGMVRRRDTGKKHLRYSLDVPEERKGALLFNRHRVDTTRAVVLVEGITDAMWVHQAGYTNVVAILGSFAKREQIQALRGCTDFALMLDTDESGREGTRRTIKSLRPLGTVSVTAKLPNPKDPPNNSLHDVLACIDQRQPATRWLLAPW